MLKLINSAGFSHKRETYQFCRNGTPKCTHGLIDNYFAIILVFYHRIRNRQSIWDIGTMKHTLSLSNNGIPFVIPKAHLDAILCPNWRLSVPAINATRSEKPFKHKPLKWCLISILFSIRLFFTSLQSEQFNVIQIIYNLGHKLKLSIFTVPYVTILTFARTWHLYCCICRKVSLKWDGRNLRIQPLPY
jgi:hypothetical protein